MLLVGIFLIPLLCALFCIITPNSLAWNTKPLTIYDLFILSYVAHLCILPLLATNPTVQLYQLLALLETCWVFSWYHIFIHTVAFSVMAFAYSWPWNHSLTLISVFPCLKDSSIKKLFGHLRQWFSRQEYLSWFAIPFSSQGDQTSQS